MIIDIDGHQYSATLDLFTFMWSRMTTLERRIWGEAWYTQRAIADGLNIDDHWFKPCMAITLGILGKYGMEA